MRKKAEIRGTLYKDEEGDIILLNEQGAHTILVETEGHLPRKLEQSMLYVKCHEVAWTPMATPEIWAVDIWGDLVEDLREEQGDKAANRLPELINTTFQSVILTCRE